MIEKAALTFAALIAAGVLGKSTIFAVCVLLKQNQQADKRHKWDILFDVCLMVLIMVGVGGYMVWQAFTG